MPYSLVLAPHAVQMETMLAHDSAYALEMSGVSLYIDPENEESYIETAPSFDMKMLRSVVNMVGAAGYELMDEEEFGVEVLPDGRVRHWLAMNTFPVAEREGEEMVA